MSGDARITFAHAVAVVCSAVLESASSSLHHALGAVMAGNASNLPVEQIHRFWDDVEQALRTRHGLGADPALRAILRYRDEVERVGPLVYHREASDVAEDIIAGGYTDAQHAVG